MSTIDGWWCEGYTPDGGWIIGAGENYEDPKYQDMVESQAIYNMLENEVIPLFYTRSADNLPRAWIRRVKNSIKWIAPRFNTHRMVAEYTRKFYNPAVRFPIPYSLGDGGRRGAVDVEIKYQERLARTGHKGCQAPERRKRRCC